MISNKFDADAISKQLRRENSIGREKGRTDSADVKYEFPWEEQALRKNGTLFPTEKFLPDAHARMKSFFLRWAQFAM